MPILYALLWIITTLIFVSDLQSLNSFKDVPCSMHYHRDRVVMGNLVIWALWIVLFGLTIQFTKFLGY